MELSIFDELKAGANFSSRHNKEHLQKFKKAAVADVEETFAGGANNVAPTLDFFGTSSSSATAPASGKVKKKVAKKVATKSKQSHPATKSVSRPSPLLLGGPESGEEEESSESSTSGSSSSSSDDDEDDNDDNVASTSNSQPLLLFSNQADNSSNSDDSDAEEGHSNNKDQGKGQSKAHRKSKKAGARANADQSQADRQRREQVNAFRNKMNIRIKGSDVCEPIETFRDMGPCGDKHIKRVLLQNIEKSLYKEPTPIQMQAVPILLRRRDVLAAAPTGSGKTAAFVLPILGALAVPIKSRIKNSKNVDNATPSTHGAKAGIVRAIIVAPTRELASQIQREVTKLSNGKKFRIVVLSKATAASVASAPTDILVTTPLRLLGALQSGTVDASSLEFFVLDEADKLFEMGFVEQLDQILAHIKAPGLTRAFFSATLPEGVEGLARSVLVDPVRVVIGVRNAGASTIDQQLLFVGQEQGKLQAMRQLISEGLKPPCILFVQSKERAVEVFQELVYEGINVDVLHSDRTQAQRDRIVDQFRVGKIWVLIATDIVARGMDFQGVNTVINFDFPQSSVSYVHRIGRTGRAGRRGKAITFFTESDFPALRSIANVMKLSGCDVPEWMLRLKTMKTKEKRRYRNSVPQRHSIRTSTAFDKKRKAKRDNMIAQTSKDSHRRKQARKSKFHAKAAQGGARESGGNDDGGGWTVVK